VELPRPSSTRARALLLLPPGGFALGVAPGSPAELSLGRFADRPTVRLPAVQGGSAVGVPIPDDRASRRWRAAIAYSQRTVVCSLR
jgi:hypothetical protein